MQWRKLTRLKSSPGGPSRARRMLCCGRRKDNGRAAPDLTASPGRAPPPQPPRANHATCVLQPDFRKVSGVSNEIFRQIEMVENDHDATTAAALEAVERRGEMIVRILELRQVGRNNVEAAKKFFSLQDSRHIVQLVEIVKRPGQTLGLYIREGDGGTRTDGVFISRIALESAVYNSGCLKVGDEILAVNLVDVRRMSLDDVVIIMSIPRRLLLCTRQRKGKTGPGSPSLPRPEHKPPPVVVLKRDCRDDEDRDRVDGLYSQHGTLRSMTGGIRPVGDGREERSRLQLGQLSPDSTPLDLYYNSRPPSDHSTWSYRPPPPVITEQPKPGERHFVPYERSYPNTLDSLAEKVNYYQTDSGSTRFGGRVPRSGSEQQLPRAETHSDFGRHSLLRSSLKASGAAGAANLSRYNQRYGLTGTGLAGTGLTGSGLTGSGLTGTGLGAGLPSGLSTTGLSGLTGSNLIGSGLTGSGLGTLGSALGPTYGTVGLGLSTYGSKFGTSRRNRSLDYSSDTEATAPSRTPYYTGLSGYRSSTLGRDIGSKFNSLPRDVRGTGQRLGLSRRAGSVLQDEPEPLSSRLDLRSSRGRLPSSPSVFTSDEYRAWLSRAPSTSALYETLRPRLPTHYSAENIHDALKNMENSTRFGSTLGLAGRTGRIERPRHLPARSLSSQHLGPTGGSPSARRVRQLLELGSRFNCPNPSPVPTPSSRHQRNLDINPNEFLKYKVEKTSAGLSSSMTGISRLASGISGMLWVHLLAGRELRTQPSGSSPGSPPPGLERREPPVAPRDLYCVLECDRVHKARTVVRNGELQFDWDESFELELVDNRQLDVLVYSWDPQHRHKLCYRGAVTLPDLLTRAAGSTHQLAIKMEPRGTLYVRVRHTEPSDLFRRRPAPPRLSPPSLFGAELEAVVAREVRPTHAPPVPLIVRRCVEEIERRGLDIIGLYRLCGSASKKRILREAFERNTRGVELSPDSVPDINVITGLLKDYLRELPQPLFSRCLYQMTLDALGVCLPDDREGNARLMASIVECLPRAARATLVFLLDHLALVVAAQDRNKMSPQHLSVAMAPPLMLHTQPGQDLDYQRPIHALQCLLQIWPAPKRSDSSARRASTRAAWKQSQCVASGLSHPPPRYTSSWFSKKSRAPPSVSPYRLPVAASAVSQPPAPLARPVVDRSPPAHALSSVKGAQYRPQSPLRGPLPAPPRSRQVTVSSPGSPSSSSGSHSPADTIKHGGSISSILRQPERSSSPRHSPRHSPRNSPRDSPRSTPREGSSREMTPKELTPRESVARELNGREFNGREPIVRDQIAREQMARDTILRESLARDKMARENLARDQNRESIRESVARDQMARESINHATSPRDQITRDSITRDQMTRVSSPRDEKTKEAIARDQVRDSINRDQIARESTARDKIARDAREQISQSMAREAMVRDISQTLARESLAREQLSQSTMRDQMSRDQISSTARETISQSIARDPLSRDHLIRDSMIRDQMTRDSGNRDQITRNSVNREQIIRDSIHRDQISLDSINRDSMKHETFRDKITRDAMNRDQITLDSLNRDHITRDSIISDQITARESMVRDQMNRELMARDQMTRESIARDQLTCESMARDHQVSRESMSRDLPQSLSRDQLSRDHLTRDSMNRDQMPRESMSRELSGSRESPRSAIPGTSAGLAVTMQAVGAVSPRYNTATNPFLQQYDAEAEAEVWRAADIFSPPAHT